MSKQRSDHRQVQTWPTSFLSTSPRGGGKCSAGLCHLGNCRPWQPWPDTSISIYRLPGLQDLFWKGASTLPGIESLLVYLEMQI